MGFQIPGSRSRLHYAPTSSVTLFLFVSVWDEAKMSVTSETLDAQYFQRLPNINMCQLCGYEVCEVSQTELVPTHSRQCSPEGKGNGRKAVASMEEKKEQGRR